MSAAKPPRRLPSAPRLLLDSWKSLAAHWKTLIGTAAVIAVPSAILQWLTGEGDEVVSAYLSLGALLMNLALIWVIMERSAGRKQGIKAAYYQGTARLVPFVLVGLVLTLQLAPFMLGYLLFTIGSQSGSVAASVEENLLLGLVWLVLALPSVYWLNRYLLSVFAVSARQSPVAALKQSGRRVRGRSLAVLGRLLLLGAVVLILLTIPSLAAPLADRSAWLSALLQLFTSLILLPLVYLYLYKLYLALE